jgi:NAD(P)-dependent dehydrogenase (short-subunit alcohol dehydrogenase family)
VARYDLNGKVALVTGAARGIGFETARLLHERGASVTLLDLDEQATEQAAAQIGERTLALAADVTDRERMEDAVQATVERFGGLDVPIANAGVAPPQASMRVVDPEAWERTVEIDLLGVWRTVRPALAQVVARRGHVVVVSSVYAWVNGVLASSYAISKAGVEQLGRALRVELSIHGASATVAHFGFIDTKMVQDSFADPIAHKFEETFPAFARRRLSPEQAAAGIVKAIENRRARVIMPGWWKGWFALRGMLNPLFDAAMARDKRYVKLLREADVDERVSERGSLAATTATD